MTTLDPAHPRLYPRRALVCLSGLTPQVVTETLYALLTTTPAFVPSELHIVTTTEGKRRAQALLSGDGGRGGVLRALWRDYAPADAPLPAFDPATHVHLISEGDTALADVTEAGHHLSTADSVLAALRPLLVEDDMAVHTSIAGGRKSMSFYMGYVMSLLARKQDRMSHVLINAPFDSLPAFSYPPREPVDLELPGGGSISTSEARVGLAEVAFVKISHHLPEQLRGGQHSFESLVRQAQAALEGIRVTIDCERRIVAIDSSGVRLAEVKLEPLELGLYAYLAYRRQRCGVIGQGHDDTGLVEFKTEAMAVSMQGADWLYRLESALELANKGDLQLEWRHSESVRIRRSKVERKLKQALEEKLFLRVRINGPRDRGTNDGRYGLLGLAPSEIHFGNA